MRRTRIAWIAGAVVLPVVVSACATGPNHAWDDWQSREAHAWQRLAEQHNARIVDRWADGIGKQLYSRDLQRELIDGGPIVFSGWLTDVFRSEDEIVLEFSGDYLRRDIFFQLKADAATVEQIQSDRPLKYRQDYAVVAQLSEVWRPLPGQISGCLCEPRRATGRCIAVERLVYRTADECEACGAVLAAGEARLCGTCARGSEPPSPWCLPTVGSSREGE